MARQEHVKPSLELGDSSGQSEELRGPGCRGPGLLHLTKLGCGYGACTGVKWLRPQRRRPVGSDLGEAAVRAEMSLFGLRKPREELGSG